MFVAVSEIDCLTDWLSWKLLRPERLYWVTNASWLADWLFPPDCWLTSSSWTLFWPVVFCWTMLQDADGPESESWTMLSLPSVLSCEIEPPEQLLILSDVIWAGFTASLPVAIGTTRLAR